MRILHTSDWHLGKRLMDRERLPEQIAALERLVSICDENAVDVVLIAGDVFDTFTPPAEAEAIFYRAAKKLAGSRRAVVAISGNHDDAVRLCAACPIAEEEGVYLFGEGNFSLHSSRPVHPVASGTGYLVLQNEAGEKVYINALPYPTEARLREEKTEETYAEKVARWIARGDEGYDGSLPHILLSHLFAMGGSVSEGERDIDLGGARAVPISVFPQEGYVALGHLHKRQKLGENIYYSGSLLQYSFDEGSEKTVFLLETRGKEVVLLGRIPVEGGKKLVRLEADGVENALGLLARYPDCFVELTLHLTAPLTANETASLREANEGLVSLITIVAEGETVPIVRRAELKEDELFAAFYRAMYGEEPSKELTEAFLTLLSEECDETVKP